VDVLKNLCETDVNDVDAVVFRTAEERKGLGEEDDDSEGRSVLQTSEVEGCQSLKQLQKLHKVLHRFQLEVLVAMRACSPGDRIRYFFESEDLHRFCLLNSQTNSNCNGQLPKLSHI
jgi:hypothetical protein